MLNANPHSHRRPLAYTRALRPPPPQARFAAPVPTHPDPRRSRCLEAQRATTGRLLHYCRQCPKGVAR